jgi:hypothetical protein
MPPVANGRRTRRVIPPAPAEADAVPVITEVPPALAAKPRAKSASQLRRVQEATADPKRRVPRAKRAAETADETISVPLAGKPFLLNETIGIMPLMQWAAALDVVDVKSVPQLASFYRLLKALVHEENWEAFCEHATEAKCSDQDLLDFYSASIEAMSARPTKEPAAS